MFVLKLTMEVIHLPMALMDLSSTIEQLAEHHRQLLGYHKFCKMSGILLMAPLLDTLGRS